MVVLYASRRVFHSFKDLFLQNTEDDQIVKEQVSQLLSNLDTLRKQNKKLQESNRNLSCNISVLYNTAATEIERKDEVIADLRRQ